MASPRPSISAGSRHSGSTVISLDDANDNKQEKKVEQQQQQQHEQEQQGSSQQDEKKPAQDDDNANTSTKKSPLEILRIIVLLFGMMLSMFTVTINSTLVAPAMTMIATDLHALNNSTWIATAFMVGMVGLQPLSGKVHNLDFMHGALPLY